MRLKSLVLACAAATAIVGPSTEAMAQPRTPKAPQTSRSVPESLQQRIVRIKAKPTVKTSEAGAQPAKPVTIADPSAKASPAAKPSPAKGQLAVKAALSKLGSRYRYGANGPDRFDCSGLTSWAWAQAGVTIPRTSSSQFRSLPRVSLDALQPGDLVYSPGHIGMYIGDGKMVHSPQTGRSVEIAPLRPRASGAVRPA